MADIIQYIYIAGGYQLSEASRLPVGGQHVTLCYTVITLAVPAVFSVLEVVPVLDTSILCRCAASQAQTVAVERER